MRFLDDRRMSGPAGPAMHRPAPTNGSRSFAASRDSAAACASIKLSCRLPTRKSMPICGAPHNGGLSNAPGRNLQVSCSRIRQGDLATGGLPVEGGARGAGTFRSGNGGHVRTFFDAALPAALARRPGIHLPTEAVARHPDIGFGSCDRFFPSQDRMPEGGFGNLIAPSFRAARGISASTPSSMTTWIRTRSRGRRLRPCSTCRLQIPKRLWPRP